MRISDWSSDVCSSDLVRAVGCVPTFLGRLLVDVGPVEDLVLGELAVGDRAERRARQVQVMRRRQSEVIVGDAVLRLLALGQCFLGRVVQVPGGIAPGTEVVLVDDDAIPVDQRSEEHTSELQSLMRISYAVFRLK